MIKNLARTYSAELEGINARLIEVEIDINVGLHAFNIVGLADRALNEARERVNSAIKNSGAKPPNRENRKITVNLAPADVKKTGSHYDLAIALGYLFATKQIARFETSDKIFVGELALDGRLRPISGALNIAELAAKRGFRKLFLPPENAAEAAAIKNIRIVAVENLTAAIAILEGRGERASTATQGDQAPQQPRSSFPDFSEIVGQENAKRALTIAASGNHNLLFAGSPGVGKSMLARALVRILPPPTLAESIEITKIWSAAGLSPGRLVTERPFRAPHQTSSALALVGGGGDPRPGEISLAHRGILFLDELPEFSASALEALREPMESGVIRVARAKRSVTFPAKFALVAAMNPCPCGFYGDPDANCTCGAYEVIRYQRKISGPLLDRIDLQVRVGRVKVGELREDGERATGAEMMGPKIKQSVEAARGRQAERFKNSGRSSGLMTNADMTSREVRGMVALEPTARKFLETFDTSRVSARGYYRILKVARTIADIENADLVSAEHLAEAFSYRLRDDTS